MNAPRTAIDLAAGWGVATQRVAGRSGVWVSGREGEQCRSPLQHLLDPAESRQEASSLVG